MKNALLQLTNVFGNIHRTLKIVGLKHEAAPRRNLLPALRPTGSTFNKKNGSIIGFQHQRTIDLIDGYCSFIMTFILNNGNILTDSKNEMGYLEIKCNYCNFFKLKYIY